MKLSEEVKKLIIDEFEAFKAGMYAGKSKAERKLLGQYFTPPQVTFRMLENYDVDSLAGLKIIDPTCGSGNLLAACLIAGADSDKLFGNDKDGVMVDICRKRLNDLCVKLNKPIMADWQIHQGTASLPVCFEFSPDYDKTTLRKLLLQREYIRGNWLDNPEHYGEPEQVSLFGGLFN